MRGLQGEGRTGDLCSAGILPAVPLPSRRHSGGVPARCRRYRQRDADATRARNVTGMKKVEPHRTQRMGFVFSFPPGLSAFIRVIRGLLFLFRILWAKAHPTRRPLVGNGTRQDEPRGHGEHGEHGELKSGLEWKGGPHDSRNQRGSEDGEAKLSFVCLMCLLWLSRMAPLSGAGSVATEGTKGAERKIRRRREPRPYSLHLQTAAGRQFPFQPRMNTNSHE